MHAEHLARYRWAAQLVSGRKVLDAGCGTGYGSEALLAGDASRLVAVDLSSEAVDETARRLGDRASVHRADVRELPFSDASFDVVVSFEVIEHIAEPDRALREFARVLRPDGVLAISSPNRDRYLPGNPHHRHEYTPAELGSALRAHFEHVTLVPQQAYIASVIDAAGLPDNPASEVIADNADDGAGTYMLALAGTRPTSLPAPWAVLADQFEVRWWSEQVDLARRAADATRGEDARRRTELETSLREEMGRRKDVERQLLLVEQERGRAVVEQADAEAQLEEGRLVIEAAQEQTRVVTEDLCQRLQRAEMVIADLTGSVSWRLTVPLRTLKALLRPARRRAQ